MEQKIDTARDLRSVQIQLQGVLDAAVDGIIMIDRHGKIELFNRAAENIFGYTESEMIGKNVSCLMPSPDREQHDTYLLNYLSGRPAKIIGIGRDVTGLRRHGETFPMNLAVGRMEGPEGTKFVGLVRDITKTEKLKAAFDVINDEFRFVYNEAPIGIFILSPDGQILSANPWFTDFLSYREEELTNVSFEKLLHSENKDKVALALHDVSANNKKATNVELRLLNKDGSAHHVTIHFTKVDSAVAQSPIFGLVIDRTDEFARMLVTQQARERIAHSDRLNSLGEMAFAIAHEINQPLTAITAYAQACIRLFANKGGSSKAELGEEIISSLEKIATQAHRGAEIIRRIRGFASKGGSEKQVSDINQDVLAAIELSKFSASQSGVSITADLDQGLPSVLIDQIQIQQVCINLIRNAVDAMQLAPETARWLKISSHRKGNSVAVTFEDRGCGVPHELKDRLFEPFQTSKKNGLGLGLSISYKIISNHHGSMNYTENPLGGSIFDFTIPVTESEP